MSITVRHWFVGLLLAATLTVPTGCALDRASVGERGSPLEETRRGFMRHEIDQTREILRDGPLPEAHRALARVLPDWAGTEATLADRAAVAEALPASGLYREARLVALGLSAVDSGTPEVPQIASIIGYADFLRRIEETTDEYYRRTALGEGDPEAWRVALIEAAGALWPALAWDGERPPFDPRAALPELAERFGAEVRLGTTAGYEDLHYGHVVIDERRTIEQHDEVAELRFVALDGIVSNGFQSWAWTDGPPTAAGPPTTGSSRSARDTQAAVRRSGRAHQTGGRDRPPDRGRLGLGRGRPVRLPAGAPGPDPPPGPGPAPQLAGRDRPDR